MGKQDKKKQKQSSSSSDSSSDSSSVSRSRSRQRGKKQQKQRESSKSQEFTMQSHRSRTNNIQISKNQKDQNYQRKKSYEKEKPQKEEKQKKIEHKEEKQKKDEKIKKEEKQYKEEQQKKDEKIQLEEKQNKEEKPKKEIKLQREEKKHYQVTKKEQKQEPIIQEEETDKKIVIPETDLIESLREQPNYLAEKYNEKKQKQELEQAQKIEQEQQKIEPRIRQPKNIITRAGGVYVPPHKLAQIQSEMMQSAKFGEEHQKLMWELLRKSINGIVNKVNIANIQNVIIELFNENILRGKGLLTRGIIKAQMTAPNFTHVYTALIAVINTKLPEIVNLILKRVILQFQRAYKRNIKLVCQATIKMLAHLINQKVLSDYAGLQLLLLFLENPTEDTVELACDFMTECGQVLSDLSPAGVNAIFERFKGILHEGEIERRVQYCIEALFAVRKTKFKDHQGVIPELDLVEADDQITHNFDLMDMLDPEDMLNIFHLDPFFEKTEMEWDEIKKEILGEENMISLKQVKRGMDEEEENEEEQAIQDFTEEDIINLRRTLYLTIMSSIDYQECTHKILKMNIGVGHEDEIVNMIIDCCENERTYMRFFGLLAQHFCDLSEVFRDNFMKAFVQKYSYLHRLETNKLRNSAKLFAHLFFTDSVDWRVLNCITLTQEATTSSSRIFIKNLIQELSENMGLEKLNQKFSKEEDAEYFQGLFPIDHPKNTRFAINFFTSIGVGALTDQLRLHLEKQTKEALMLQINQQVDLSDANEDSSSSDSDDSSSDSSSSASSQKKKKNPKKKNEKR